MRAEDDAHLYEDPLTPEQLEKLRVKYGFRSWYELAKRAGISRIRISDHVNGVKPLSPRMRCRLALVFTQRRDHDLLYIRLKTKKSPVRKPNSSSKELNHE